MTEKALPESLGIPVHSEKKPFSPLLIHSGQLCNTIEIFELQDKPYVITVALILNAYMFWDKILSGKTMFADLQHNLAETST